MLSVNARVRRKDDEIVAKIMDGEAVIINLANGLYYSTDLLGGTIWSMIEADEPLSHIIATIVARYDVAHAQAQADTLRLVDELLAQDLVSVVESVGVAAALPLAPPVVAPPEKLPYAAPQLSAYSDLEELLALDPPTPGFADIPWKE
jgi:hypothetical protein